jgi:pyruvate dehydrogenase E2 component (dihydrolipoamide acetyltransferase)
MMAGVREFALPDLGEGLTEAEIIRWLVQVGEVVAVDQPVVEVETAKAMVEVPCPYSGVVTALFGEEGTEVQVGWPLLTVAVGGEEASGSESGSGSVLVGYGTGVPERRRRRVRPGPDGGRDGAGSGPAHPGVPVAVPAADRSGRVAAGGDSAPVPPAGIPGEGAVTGAGGRSQTAGMDALPPDTAAGGAVGPGAPGIADPTGWGEGRGGAGDGPVAVISPLVRRIARQHGVDLRSLAGTGPDGLILRTDVERAMAAARSAPRAAGGNTEQPVAGPLQGIRTAPESGPGGEAAGRQGTAGPAAGGGRPEAVAHGGGSAGTTGVEAERIPLRGVRGAIAEKSSRSRREIPDATCWVDADATELLAARAAMNAPGGAKVTVLALLARICTSALARYPELNATVDAERGEIVRLPAVHLGFAAQTERGLIVPVVRDAQGRTTEALAAEIARLTEASRQGSLSLAEVTGATFTLNNYGVFGVDGATPIINHPEAAMLGVGRIAPKPWVHQGKLAVRQVVQLSFTFDHRVCDGGAAGGFLRFVADCVEQPAVLLRTA